jgi:hypothetical protein
MQIYCIVCGLAILIDCVFTTLPLFPFHCYLHPAGLITVDASEEEPRYDIKNDKTGKPAAYKLANIVRKID